MWNDLRSVSHNPEWRDWMIDKRKKVDTTGDLRQTVPQTTGLGR